MINREDMLELTRRMTPSRTCMDRIAGGYMDEDGFLDGSFNIHFLKLSGEEKAKNLALAKAVPFSKTNEQLKEYEFSPTQERPGSLWQLLMAMREARLKNDALNETFYEPVSIIRALEKITRSFCFTEPMTSRSKRPTRKVCGSLKRCTIF